MVCYWTYSVKYLIFVEDKLHLGKAIQISLMSLLSICIIFAEDKLHLGIVIQTSLMPLLSICIIFVEDKLHLGIDLSNKFDASALDLHYLC